MRSCLVEQSKRNMDRINKEHKILIKNNLKKKQLIWRKTFHEKIWEKYLHFSVVVPICLRSSYILSIDIRCDQQLSFLTQRVD